VISISANIWDDDIFFEMNYEIFTNRYANIITTHPNFNKPICPNNSLTSPSKTILLSYKTEESTSYPLLYNLLTDGLELFDITPIQISMIKDELRQYYDAIGNNLLNCTIEIQNFGTNQELKVDIEKCEIVEKRMFIKTKNNKMI
jgi:hypothetical protein